jgi:glycosyltransferase involved in cell wall biosynthesis
VSGKSRQPLVSVIVPAFNAQATLEETIQSALASTCGHIEVVIVDDGSTDRTGAIAADLASDPRVRVVTQQNRGLPGALNTGLAEARGEFVARLDADDLWHPEKLEKQLELAASEASPDFIYTFYRYIDEQGRVLFDGPPQQFPAHALRRSIYETLIGTGSSMLMRRSALERLGGFDETFRNSEDLLFQVKVASRHTIGCVPEYLVGYRLRARSLSQDAEAMRDVWLQLRRSLRNGYPQVPARVHRWTHARRSMSMAEGFARSGRYGQSARLLGTALLSDPLWSAAHLAYRAARAVRRAVSGGGQARPGLPFLEYDPAEARDANSALYGTEGTITGRLHKRRVRWLSALDASEPVAPRSPSPPPPESSSRRAR